MICPQPRCRRWPQRLAQEIKKQADFICSCIFNPQYTLHSKKSCRSHSGNQRTIHGCGLLPLLFDYINFFGVSAPSGYSDDAVGHFLQGMGTGPRKNNND
jgi:hypothetical protein